MKCKECDSCRKGFFKSQPDAYVCIGVKNPFVVEDINHDCTEYPERNNENWMDIREKLVDLMLEEALEITILEDGELLYLVNPERLASCLIASGMMMQPNLPNKPRKICPTTGLECIACVPGSPCAKEDVTDG